MIINESHPLRREQLERDPFAQWASWYTQAEKKVKRAPNAIVLATATADGIPSSRFMLLKGVDERGFLLYTNLESRKSKEIEENPKASLTIFWESLARQVHIRGDVEKLPDDESSAYFDTRPRESQLGAWASRQDSVLVSRDILESGYEEAEERYRDKEIPKPPYWGGYRVVPHEFEFWQGAPHRLHDRFLYTLQDDEWLIQRLSP